MLVALAGTAVGGTLIATALITGEPLIVPLLLGALLAAPLMLLRPTACLVLLTVVEAGNLSGVAGTHGVPAVHATLLGLALAAGALAIVRGKLRPCWSPVFPAALVLLVAQSIAAVAARDFALSYPVVLETARGLVFLFLVTTLLTGLGDSPRAVTQAFVITLATLSVITIVQEFVLGNATTFGGLSNVALGADVSGVTARHAGPQQDVNFWGRVLVVAVPFALSLAIASYSRARRVCWLVGALTICIGIYLTQSRGGLLALGLAVAVWALLAGRRFARLLLLAPLFIALALATPGLGNRLATLSNLGAPPSLAAPDASLQGRLAVQEAGLQMVVDHPLIGVGPGNFAAAQPEYLRQLGLQTDILAPHNHYLQAAAEGGIVGLAALLLFLGTALFVALRARILTRPQSPETQTSNAHTLATAVAASLAGWAGASLFLHLATFRTLLLVVALGAALDVRARRAMAAPSSSQGGTAALAGVAPQRSHDPFPLAASIRSLAATAAPTQDSLLPSWVRPLRESKLALIAVLLAVGFDVLVGTSSLVRQQAWEATASARVALKDSLPQHSGAYELDTLSRDSLVRTFATIVAEERLVPRPPGQQTVAQRETTVDVTIVPPSTVITVRVFGPDRATASSTATSVLGTAAGKVNSLSQLYGLQPVPDGTTARPVEVLVLPRLGALFLLNTAAFAVVGFAYRVRRRHLMLAPGAKRPPARTAATSDARERQPEAPDCGSLRPWISATRLITPRPRGGVPVRRIPFTGSPRTRRASSFSRPGGIAQRLSRRTTTVVAIALTAASLAGGVAAALSTVLGPQQPPRIQRPLDAPQDVTTPPPPPSPPPSPSITVPTQDSGTPDAPLPDSPRPNNEPRSEETLRPVERPRDRLQEPQPQSTAPEPEDTRGPVERARDRLRESQLESSSPSP